jgi:hypothetical protein
MGNYKYAYFTDQIYRHIFRENANEYKKVLQLEEKENPRDTMYSEILTLIASFETGLAYEIEKLAQLKSRQLSKTEIEELIVLFAEHPQQKPFIENARVKMATRDYGFRQILHDNLNQYINSIDLNDYQRFLGERSKALEERLTENLEVFLRLKDR